MTMRPALISLMLTALLAGAADRAHAQAYTQSTVELRLGPGTDWTILTELPASTFVRIMGCDPRFNWCQVNVPEGLQGWLPCDSLRDARDDKPLRQNAQGQAIDFPVIIFTGIQFGQPVVPGAATQRHDITRRKDITERKDITQRKPLPKRPSDAASSAQGREAGSANNGAVAPMGGGGEREPVFAPRGGPR